MNIIFVAPAGTGKTKFANELAKHFGCDRVFDDGLGPDIWPKSIATNKVLVLVTSGHHIGPGQLLTQEDMNRAMVAVAGMPIWNDDGTVNAFGKRAEVKA